MYMYIVTYQISFISGNQLTSAYVLMSHALLLYLRKIDYELPVISNKIDSISDM